MARSSCDGGNRGVGGGRGWHTRRFAIARGNRLVVCAVDDSGRAVFAIAIVVGVDNRRICRTWDRRGFGGGAGGWSRRFLLLGFLHSKLGAVLVHRSGLPTDRLIKTNAVARTGWLQIPWHKVPIEGAIIRNAYCDVHQIFDVDCWTVQQVDIDFSFSGIGPSDFAWFANSDEVILSGVSDWIFGGHRTILDNEFCTS